MKTIVISGINLFEGGPLSIYKDCLDTVIELGIQKEYQIIAFVHKKELFKEYASQIQLIELPLSRKSYLFRLYYEYWYFRKFSKGKKINVWLSLHDITPNVKAEKLYTYCHNPTIFLKVDYRLWKYSKNVFIMSKLYKYLYKINIKRNDAIIVQQNWIRDKFIEMYAPKKVVVAKPNINCKIECNHYNKKQDKKKSFIFASYPRPFKNFEVVCAACKHLEKQGYDFQMYLTVEGSENRYSSDLYNKYKDVRCIKWLGILNRNDLFEYYSKVDCMIFPSKLETWGLPISEFREWEKPMILADLPYAHETVGSYEKVNFFTYYDYEQLARYMKDIIIDNPNFDGNIVEKDEKDIYENWSELLQKLICK